MAEVARLDVILAGNTDQFTVAMGKASSSVVNFSKISAAASELRPFSNATASALQAAKSVEQLKDVMAQLKIEQAAVTNPKELQAYNSVIKSVATEIKGLGSTGGAAAGFGKALTGALGSVKQLAYILPGLGMAGIFNLAFEAISKAATSLNLFGSKTKELTQDEKDLQKAMEGFEESAAKDVFQFMRLSEIASSTDNPYNIRLDAVKKLRDEYPNYLKGLSDEQILTGDTANALKEVNQALIAKLTLEAGEEQIVKLLKQRFDVQVKLNKLQSEQLTTSGFAASLKDATGLAKGLGVQLQAAVTKSLPDNAKYEKSIKDISAQVESLFNILKSDVNKSAALDLTDPITKTKKAIEELTPAIKKLSFAGQITFQEPPSVIGNLITKELDKSGGIKVKPKVVLNPYIVNAEELGAKLQDILGKIAEDAATAIGTGIGNVLSGKKNPFQSLFTILGEGIKALGKQLIEFSGIAKLVQVALAQAVINPYLALAAGVALEALGTVIANKGVQLHAEGGIFTQPTQWGNHIIGEKGPEALVPLNRMGELGIAGGGRQVVVMETRISGNDLILIQNRAQTAAGRAYGNNFNRRN